MEPQEDTMIIFFCALTSSFLEMASAFQLGFTHPMTAATKKHFMDSSPLLRGATVFSGAMAWEFPIEDAVLWLHSYATAYTGEAHLCILAHLFSGAYLDVLIINVFS